MSAPDEWEDVNAQVEAALRRGVGDLAIAIGQLEAHWEVCCGDPEHLPPVQLRTTLKVMGDAVRAATETRRQPPSAGSRGES
jgi:hypothetical protein